ncbi:MAG: ribonuclease H [Deltaproteobacteria bacterium CG11_big_fil_rev_8_21_14_0_20_47_16]|nr:MAG: ribonuclease H [Deltaproteobacteria bacterium CG11_big_fil_rev_8_21_14_0_20_47_16]
MKPHQLFTDGGARGNPGPAGAGAILRAPDGTELEAISAYLGEMTNNQAEYRALLLGLQAAIDNDVRELEVCMDSELIVKQMKGEYKVKNPGMKELYQEAKVLVAKFDVINFTHIRREFNSDADLLVNQAIDAHI